MTTELSVIIPSYNTGSFICDAVESIINDVPNSEIIVVDDASSDNAVELHESKGIGWTIIQLEKNTSGGAGIPSNIGIDKAEGEYITFVDSDIFL